MKRKLRLLVITAALLCLAVLATMLSACNLLNLNWNNPTNSTKTGSLTTATTTSQQSSTTAGHLSGSTTKTTGKTKSTTKSINPSGKTTTKKTTTQTKPGSTKTSSTPSATTKPVGTTTPFRYIAFETLTTAEKSLYEIMEAAVAAKADRVRLNTTDIDTVKKIYSCLYADHREYFWMMNGFPAYIIDGKGITLQQMREYSTAEISSMQTKITGAILTLMQDAPDSSASEYEKVKWVYEKIILTTTYDINSADNQNAYSVFVGRKSVCNGYASAAQILLHRLGVSCSMVNGTATNSAGGTENHAWNLVMIDNAYYQTDVTWGDAEQGSLSFVNYAYLNLSTAEITRNKNHVISGNGYPIPKCTAMAANYFVKEGYRFDTDDNDILTTAVSRQLERGINVVQLQFNSLSDYQLVYKKLKNGMAPFVADGLRKSGRTDLRSGQYSYNDDLFVIVLIYKMV